MRGRSSETNERETMKATSFWSQAEQAHIVELIVDERDLSNTLNSREIMREVRVMVAQEITNRIMEKLGPAIDTAIAGASVVPSAANTSS